MKFLADMGISLRTVDWLRELGHDVVHLRDRGLQKLPDDEILDLARVERRIILTIDLDFAQLLAVNQKALPSVIIFRLGNENYDEINQRLIEVVTSSVSKVSASQSHDRDFTAPRLLSRTMTAIKIPRQIDLTVNFFPRMSFGTTRITKILMHLYTLGFL